MATKTGGKKNKDPPPANGASSVNTNDVRVAQQMRVLEVVGAGKNAKEDKKYSPRTENHIKQLTDLLDCFQYNRADIAALVRRCHHDEQQIQIAVANIIEDKANHGVEDWGEVKSKKQLKEEKKIRDEEERKEQEAMEKELERQRKEAEKRAKKDAERQRGQRGGHRNDYDYDDWGGEAAPADGGKVALPPDPAILFAGSKPTEEAPEKGNDDWWDDKWDQGWDGGAKSTSRKDKDWEEDWKWKGQSWDENEWADEGGRGNGKDDEWWQEEWKTQEKRGKKAPKERAASSKGKQEKPKQEPQADSMDMWDMPDVNASNEGGLDQFTLGDIRAHDADAPKGFPPESAMLTVEEIERQQFGLSPSKPPPPAADGGGADRSERGGEKGRGRGRGGDRKEGRGRGGGDRGDKADRDKGKPPADPEGDKGNLERLDRSDDPRRQPMEEVGENVTVRKHSSMGCAVVSMKDTRVRDAILRLGNEIIISGIRVQMKPHTDKETKMEIPTDIFVAWGRQVEKTSPLSERELTKYFDTKHQDFLSAWRGEEEKQRQAEEAARQQKLLEEQQRQQAEQRRAYEAEMLRRQHEEADSQRKADEQRRLDEQRRVQQETTQAIWAAGARGAGGGADPRAAAGLGSAGALNSVGQATQSGHAQDPMSHPSASAAGLTAAAYAQNPQAAAQWQHWMQTMAYHTQQQQAAGWQQQLAQRAGMQMPAAMAQQLGAQQQMAGRQDYDQLRQQAAYYAYLAQADQQRQQGGAQAAAAQAAFAQQGGYQQAGAQFGYGAAAYGSRGERI